MLAKAAVRTTLPETRSKRNTENSQTRARNAAVRAVLLDKRLTPGCKNFYVFIDQFYGWNGLVCPKLETLVNRFGLCRRSCQRWYEQLRECGYLTTEKRNGRACRHRLTWAQSVAPEAAAVSPQCPINANEENIEPERAVEPSGQPDGGPASEINELQPEIPAKPDGSACPYCHGTHYRTIVEWVRAGNMRHRTEKRVLCRCGC